MRHSIRKLSPRGHHTVLDWDTDTITADEHQAIVLTYEALRATHHIVDVTNRRDVIVHEVFDPEKDYLAMHSIAGGAPRLRPPSDYWHYEFHRPRAGTPSAVAYDLACEILPPHHIQELQQFGGICYHGRIGDYWIAHSGVSVVVINGDVQTLGCLRSVAAEGTLPMLDQMLANYFVLHTDERLYWTTARITIVSFDPIIDAIADAFPPPLGDPVPPRVRRFAAARSGTVPLAALPALSLTPRGVE